MDNIGDSQAQVSCMGDVSCLKWDCLLGGPIAGACARRCHAGEPQEAALRQAQQGIGEGPHFCEWRLGVQFFEKWHTHIPTCFSGRLGGSQNVGPWL